MNRSVPIHQRIAYVKLLIFFVLFTTYLAAQAECKDAQIERAALQTPNHGTVEAIACSTSETTGNVVITVSVNGKRMAAVHTTYESGAYVPSIDTTIRFRKNHEQGFGVSTGRGRDGNGMHYWTISGDGAQLIDLGEAPALTRDRYSKETYSALISSTGDHQSVRYFYEIKDNAFVAVKAIRFSTPNPKFFTVNTIFFEKDGQIIVGRKRTLSLKQGNACMEGKNSCW